MLKKFLPLLILPLVLVGCATTKSSNSSLQSTNLTPLRQSRSANNLYTVEMSLASYQQTLRWDSIKPQIVVGQETYPMRPTLLMTNRWEGVLPVAPGTSEVHYHYKVDYEYNAFGAPKAGTTVSREYTLHVTD